MNKYEKDEERSRQKEDREIGREEEVKKENVPFPALKKVLLFDERVILLEVERGNERLP